MEETRDELVGRNLRSFREAAGLTQTQLADAITAAGIPGVGKTAIAKIEAGTRQLRFMEGVEAARALNVDPIQLAPGPGAPDPGIVAVEADLIGYIESRNRAATEVHLLEETRIELQGRVANILREAPESPGPMGKRLDRLRRRAEEELPKPTLEAMKEFIADLERGDALIREHLHGDAGEFITTALPNVSPVEEGQDDE